MRHFPKQQQQPQQPQQPKFPLERFFFEDFMMSNSRVDIAAGAARRRRERLRSMLRHERMSVAMALAEVSHHTAPRGQRTARAGVWGREMHYTATFRDPPPTHTPAGALQSL